MSEVKLAKRPSTKIEEVEEKIENFRMLSLSQARQVPNFELRYQTVSENKT